MAAAFQRCPGSVGVSMDQQQHLCMEGLGLAQPKQVLRWQGSVGSAGISGIVNALDCNVVLLLLWLLLLLL